MEIWLFDRPKDRQREKIIPDVFVSGRFGGTSCAKNSRSSELLFRKLLDHLQQAFGKRYRKIDLCRLRQLQDS
ncbi:MAG: hypothetical protein ACREOI_25430 [bacterium]